MNLGVGFVTLLLNSLFEELNGLLGFGDCLGVTSCGFSHFDIDQINAL